LQKREVTFLGGVDIVDVSSQSESEKSYANARVNLNKIRAYGCPLCLFPSFNHFGGFAIVKNKLTSVFYVSVFIDDKFRHNRVKICCSS